MKYQNFIDRKEEILTLERLYKSQKSEFVATYGHRCVATINNIDRRTLTEP